MNKNQFWISTQNNKNVILKIAQRDFIILYSGQPIEIKKGQQFYQNPLTKQVLIGWHGSIMPPFDMEGKSLV